MCTSASGMNGLEESACLMPGQVIHLPRSGTRSWSKCIIWFVSRYSAKCEVANLLTKDEVFQQRWASVTCAQAFLI